MVITDSMNQKPMPFHSSEYELGTSYSKALRQAAGTGVKTRQAILLDLLGDDLTLLAPLRHLLESPNFLELFDGVMKAEQYARRDALLSELRTWCNDQTLERLAAFLMGVLNFTSSEENIGCDGQVDSVFASESIGDSANTTISTASEETATTSQSSTAKADDSSTSTEETTSKLREMAHLASLTGDHQLSIDLLTEALHVEPANADLYMQRASLYAKNQDAGSALNDFTSVLRLEPNNHHARAQRGQAYALLGDMNAAVNDWEKATSVGHP